MYLLIDTDVNITKVNVITAEMLENWHVVVDVMNGRCYKDGKWQPIEEEKDV